MESAKNGLTGGEAFHLYLQARREWNLRTPSSIQKAMRYLDRAISLSGSFPLACAGWRRGEPCTGDRTWRNP
jgi:hypothetical protein